MDERPLCRTKRNSTLRTTLRVRPLHRGAHVEPHYPQTPLDDILLDLWNIANCRHRTPIYQTGCLDQQQHSPDDYPCDTYRHHPGVRSTHDLCNIICYRHSSASCTFSKQHFTGRPLIPAADSRKQKEFPLGKTDQLRCCTDCRIYRHGIHVNGIFFAMSYLVLIHCKYENHKYSCPRNP